MGHRLFPRSLEAYDAGLHFGMGHLVQLQCSCRKQRRLNTMSH